MNQFPYLYPHSLSEVERLNEEELWQDNRDAELDDTVTVYRGVTTINSDNLLALSWTLDYETAV